MKNELLKICKEFVAEKKDILQLALEDIKEAMANETKSSVGDKFETTRAHLQSEQNNLHLQLIEVNTLETVLNSIDTNHVSAKVELGSYVVTSRSNYFIAIPIGKMVVDKTTVYGISMASPIGKLLMGKTVGEAITFNGVTSEIKGIA
ncbi:MAG: 3-oxoacyl-ACP synthase [Bacteroidetes bacterium]|nr:3-oxoacyl-ACP synthase [Bacteroidota bacterium]